MRIYRSRDHYWSCTKLADWVRRTFGGIPKPNVASFEGWNRYDKDAEAKNRFVHWLTNDGFDGLQNILYFPYDVYDAIRAYFVNRFVDKTHYLQTRLPRGEYQEIETRMLHGMFETLVDFIEIEKAWMQVVFDNDAWKKYGYPRWYHFRVLRWFKKFRCPQAGLDHLAWEMTLGDESPYQAKAAREQLELYTWWKHDRPKRPDPEDASGWGHWCECFGFGSKLTEAEKEVQKSLIERYADIEEQYHKEDEEMLIRLVKVRRSLWT